MEKIVFKPTNKQKEAHDLLKNNKIVLYGGAIRGAKSYWGCLEIITLCFKYPNSRWVLLRQSMPVMKSTLLKTFTENFINKGFHQYVKEFNQQTLTLTWNNDSQIIFMAESYDTDKELNRFRGLEINGAFIDEVNEIQEVTFDKVLERSGSWFHSPNCPSYVLMSCNPTQNWVKERFYNKWKTGTLPQGIAYIQAKITDNPHVPAEYIENLKMLPRYQYMAFVEGDWDISIKMGGEFYKCFELDKHVGETVYNPMLPLHISWDDNVNPYLPCGIFQVNGYDVFMIDEITGVNPNNTIKAVCNEIKRKYPNHLGGMFIYGDATARKDDTKIEKGYDFFRLIAEELKQYRPSLRILNSNPSVAMRGNWVNTVLEKELDDIKVLIGENCKTTINDFVNLKEASDGTKNKEMETDPKTKVRYQKYGHFTDLFDYFLCSCFSREYYSYQSGGGAIGLLTRANTKHRF
jgi:phage terminase large subunit